MTESCLECHAVIEGQLLRDEGLHGVMDEREAEACGSCHADIEHMLDRARRRRGERAAKLPMAAK